MSLQSYLVPIIKIIAIIRGPALYNVSQSWNSKCFLGLTNGSSEIPEPKPVSDSAQGQPSSTQPPPAGAIQHLIQSPRIGGAPGSGFPRTAPVQQQPPATSPAAPLQPKLP